MEPAVASPRGRERESEGIIFRNIEILEISIGWGPKNRSPLLLSGFGFADIRAPSLQRDSSETEGGRVLFDMLYKRYVKV